MGSDGINEEKRRESIRKIYNLIKSAESELVITNTEEISLLLKGSEEFNLYFKNEKLKVGALKEKTVAIIDDNTKKDCDFVFTEKGVLLIRKNKETDLYDYKNVKYNKCGKYGEILVFEDFVGYTSRDEYENKNVNIGKLYALLREIADMEALGEN